MKRLRDGGFSLIEVLICVAVIALLATLAIPRAYAAVNTSRKNQVQAELRQIHDALSRYYMDRGHYPFKLKDLTDAGFLSPKITFKSPVSGRWYFYAVDDNRDGHRAHAFILGAPEHNASAENNLYHGHPLPAGRRPDRRAFAWLYYAGGQGMNLFADNDAGPPLNLNLPTDLSTYRNSCKPAATLPCDLITN